MKYRSRHRGLLASLLDEPYDHDTPHSTSDSMGIFTVGDCGCDRSTAFAKGGEASVQPDLRYRTAASRSNR